MSNLFAGDPILFLRSLAGPLHGLGAALSELAGRQLPSHLRVGDDGALHVITHPVTFDGGVNQERVIDRIAELRKALAEPDYKRRLRDSAAWLGASA